MLRSNVFLQDLFGFRGEVTESAIKLGVDDFIAQTLPVLGFGFGPSRLPLALNPLGLGFGTWRVLGLGLRFRHVDALRLSVQCHSSVAVAAFHEQLGLERFLE